jgi:hypothetical protein
MSKFEKLARAAVLCQQRYGETHTVSFQEDTVLVRRSKHVGFRVAVAGDGELVVARHRSAFGLLVKGYRAAELAEAQAAIREVVGNRLGTLRCPHCRIALDTDDRCRSCRNTVAIADLIARANEPVPAGLFDRRCPWCGEIARAKQKSAMFRCACGAVACDRVEDVAQLLAVPTDEALWPDLGVEVRDGGALLERAFRWFRRPTP